MLGGMPIWGILGWAVVFSNDLSFRARFGVIPLLRQSSQHFSKKVRETTKNVSSGREPISIRPEVEPPKTEPILRLSASRPEQIDNLSMTKDVLTL